VSRRPSLGDLASVARRPKARLDMKILPRDGCQSFRST
jgi:hypothetical protein